ncbi:hypothetical protein EDB92DRAFT_2112552 [Lactarius akahatsu]|uniref:HMG box domain-containing protein n=1 Tax=Lactarius akahatsu TaxID=416441 RepID=A0AAD4QFZ2_9AGAM|nr:hypothetical protein EDB92DRAFT_2112552 [Lactarius akahatsu]
MASNLKSYQVSPFKAMVSHGAGVTFTGSNNLELSVLNHVLFCASGIFLPSRGLLPCAIAPNRPVIWPVKRGFATTSGDLDSGFTADSEHGSKPKSSDRKTGSGTKVVRKNKTKGKTKRRAKKAPAKPKITIKPADRPPKRPGAAFSLWLSDWIRTQPKADGILASQNYVRQAAQIWHTVSEDDKKRYKEKFENLMVEHNRRMEEWRKEIDPAVLRELNRRRARKGLPRIRGPSNNRPMSSFFRYLKEVRENTPRTQAPVRCTVLAASAGSQWRAMSEAEKAKYSTRAEFTAWREKRKEGRAKQ